ncbi:MAG: dipicolinate synthase [Oscillospiraceae bacterium]|nr:dipicolinate synthase [Oscillospiraceae bacterium]
MKIALIGGDRRAVLLAGMLLEDGHRLRSFAMERAELPEGVERAEHLQGALYGADAAVLPLPVERGGWLNAPYARLPCALLELQEALWPGQTVFGGLFPADFQRAAAGRYLPLVDFLRRPGFVWGNAALTAEGAAGLLLTESEGSLAGSRALVSGFGRVARLTARKLAALGARVTVAARRAESRAEAEAEGFEVTDFEGLHGAFDYVVNTVPERVLGEGFLCALPETALLLELASPPGGFDRNLAENLGLRCLAAPGLPGRSAPRAAAALMLREIRAAMKEERE